MNCKEQFGLNYFYGQFVTSIFYILNSNYTQNISDYIFALFHMTVGESINAPTRGNFQIMGQWWMIERDRSQISYNIY